MNVLLAILGIFCVLTTGLLTYDARTKNRKMILSRVIGFIGVSTLVFALLGAVIGLIFGAVLPGAIFAGLLGYGASTGFMYLLYNMKLGPY